MQGGGLPMRGPVAFAGINYVNVNPGIVQNVRSFPILGNGVSIPYQWSTPARNGGNYPMRQCAGVAQLTLNQPVPPTSPPPTLSNLWQYSNDLYTVSFTITVPPDVRLPPDGSSQPLIFVNPLFTAGADPTLNSSIIPYFTTNANADYDPETNRFVVTINAVFVEPPVIDADPPYAPVPLPPNVFVQYFMVFPSWIDTTEDPTP